MMSVSRAANRRRRPLVILHSNSEVSAAHMEKLYGLNVMNFAGRVRLDPAFVTPTEEEGAVHLYPRPDGDYHKLLAIEGVLTRWGELAKQAADEGTASISVPMPLAFSEMVQARAQKVLGVDVAESSFTVFTITADPRLAGKADEDAQTPMGYVAAVLAAGGRFIL